MKTLALTVDGDMTYCSVPPEMRGTRGCNHVGHREAGEDTKSFIARMETVSKAPSLGFKTAKDGYLFKSESFESTVESKLKESLHKYFKLGDESPGLKVESVETTNEYGDKINRLTAVFEWRGKDYPMHLGDVPAQDEHGRISIKGVEFQPLPVVQQYEAGFHKFGEKTVVWEKEASPNPIPAFVVAPDGVTMAGKKIDSDAVDAYLAGDLEHPAYVALHDWQKEKLNKVDPVLFERMPGATVDSLRDVEAPEPSDISWRPIKTYDDQVADTLNYSWRSVGTTFRRSVAAGKDPVFYQGKNTENVLKDLASRSNVVLANDTNPIAAESQEHAVSLTGPGGYNSNKVPAGLRDVHESHRGVLDPNEYSSGKNVALTLNVAQTATLIDSNGKRFLRRASDIDPAAKDNILSSTTEYIPFIGHNDPNRIQMATAHLKQAVPISGGEDPDIKTPAWDKIKGSKLGLNLRVAYLPQAGTFEDSVVLSESAAKRMSHTADIKYPGITLAPGKEVSAGEVIGKDEDGRDVVAQYSGRVNEKGTGITTTFAMRPGDKIAGRHGNKGVVSRVLPDDQMPKIDGEPAEILMSPLSVPGRMNPGQLMETTANNKSEPEVKITTSTGVERQVRATAGKQFIMRLNHIAEKKVSDRPMRLGEMERIILTTDDDLRKGLSYIVRQDRYRAPQQKLMNILSSLGVNNSTKE